MPLSLDDKILFTDRKFLYLSTNKHNQVAVFYQFGFEFEMGTYPWRSHLIQNTSDWFGPYNLVLPQHSEEIESRYVSTIGTDYLVSPIDQTIIDSQWFDLYAGSTAVHYSIQQQTQLTPTDDPYGDHLATCDHGDIHPVLPRLSFRQKEKTLEVDFMLLSLPPTPKDPLAKAWLTLQSHLPDLRISGPYCFQGHLGAYAINASYHGSHHSASMTTGGGGGGSNSTSTWKLTPGCVTGLPCWPSEEPPKPHGGGNDGPPTNMASLLALLVISMTINCQLSYRLQQRRTTARTTTTTNGQSTPGRRRIITRRIVTSLPVPEDGVASMDITNLSSEDTEASSSSSSLREPLLPKKEDSPVVTATAVVDPERQDDDPC